jgi:hypothetical protein
MDFEIREFYFNCCAHNHDNNMIKCCCYHMLSPVEELGLKGFLGLSISAKRIAICNCPSKNIFLHACSLFSICLVMSHVISIFNISISFVVCVYSLMVHVMDEDLSKPTVICNFFCLVCF